MSDNNLEDSTKEVVEPAETVIEGQQSPDLEIDETKTIVETPTNELNDTAILSYLSEKRGKEYNNIDELFEEKTVEIEKEFEFASEQLKTINDYVKETGRSLDDWMETQSVDLDKLSSEQLIKMELKSKYPDLTRNEIATYYSNKYKVDEDVASQSEIDGAEITAKIEAQEIRSKLKEVQSKFKLPVEKIPEQESLAQQTSEAESKAKEVFDNWNSKISGEINNLETISIAGDDVTLTPEMKTEINESVKSLNSFWKDNFVTDGQWDSQKLAKFIFAVKDNNLDAVVGNIKSSLIAEGTENVIENRKRINFTPSSKKADSIDPSLQAELDSMLAGMKEATNSNR